MNKKLFSELVESVQQGAAILHSKAEPSRAIEVTIDNEVISSTSSTSFPRVVSGNPADHRPDSSIVSLDAR